MAPLKLVNVLALTTVAIFIASFGAHPVNALSGRGPTSNPHVLSHRSHDAIAKRNRSRNVKRACRPRPTDGNNTTANSGNSGSNDNSGSNGGSNNSGGDNGGGSTDNGGGNTSTGTTSDNNPAGNNGGNSDNNTGGNSGGSQGAGSGKVCLAWANGDDPALANFQTPYSGALYTWSPILPQKLYGYKGTYMLWGENQVDQFHANVKQGGADYILGFNEPEIEGQSELTPERAAELWKEHIEPYAKQGFKLISPAVTSAPQSKKWLQNFFNACDGCTINALAMHFYDTSPDGLIAYVSDFHNTFNLPIWLTEYACQNFNGGPQCSPDDVSNFMDKVKAFAESTSWVEQYCWFGAMHDMVNVNPDNQIMDSNGQPNALGKKFLGI